MQRIYFIAQNGAFLLSITLQCSELTGHILDMQIKQSI